MSLVLWEHGLLIKSHKARSVAHILSKLLGLAKSTQINSSITTSLSLSLSLSLYDSVSDQLVENGDAANRERGDKGSFRGGFL